MTRLARPSSRLRWLAVGAATAVSSVLAFSHPSGVPPMDDTYIHLSYARWMLHGEPMQINRDEPSSGSSSPLWTALSIPAASLGIEEGPLALMLLSCLVSGACMLAASGVPLALPLLLTGPYVFHASSGMETALACLLVVLYFRMLTGSLSIRAAGPLLAAMVLTRPEMSLLAIPLLIFLIRRKGLTWPAALGRVLPAALAGLLWVGWNLHATGLPLPSTFYAKAAISAATASPVTELPGLAKGLVLASPLLLPLTVLSVARRRPGTGGPCVPTGLALLLGAALVTQPNAYFQMRYYAPVLAASAVVLARYLGDEARHGLRSALMIGCVALSLPGMAVFASRRVDASLDVDCIDRNPALLVDALADADDILVSADLGAVGWFAGGPAHERVIRDLDGLLRSRARQAGPGSPIDGSDFLLLFPGQYAGLIPSEGSGFSPIAVYRSLSPVICGEDRLVVYSAAIPRAATPGDE